MKPAALLAFVFLTTVSVPRGFAAPPESSPETEAIIALDRGYEAAYAKGDVKALADFFADDAVFTTEDGQTFTGRSEIETGIRAAFAANKGSKLSISPDSIRAATPDVVLERGSTAVVDKDGGTSGALYSAVHVKKDGKWKISSIVETPLPEESAHEHLAELDWLIGSWEDSDKSDDVTVRSEYVWARGANFLTRNVTVKRSGETTLEGWQVIGWDPLDQRIRSWTFDSEGGFAEGRWTRDGNRWLVRETGVDPDGNRTTADITFTKLSADRVHWDSNNRTLNGEPQPSISKIEINRVKGN
jgi:uncharacterized protein (TIGR02246 family)